MRQRTLTPAIQQAERLLNATLPLMGKAPPVNLGVICDWLDIEVYTSSCDAFGAMFARRDGKDIIMVNDRQPQGRLRFSVAHELGHVALNHKPLSHILEVRTPRVEWEADEFAAEILLPEHLLAAERELDAQGRHKRWKLTLPELAKRYRVSHQALTIRLGEMERAG